MLFNKSTGKSDVFSTKRLIAWLEQKPADRTYDYMSGSYCLLAQYFEENGLSRVSVTPGYYSQGYGSYGSYRSLPEGWERVAMGRNKEWTFGKALQRARALEDA